MSQNSTDCLECRLISGGGLFCIGLYVVHATQKFQKVSRYFFLGVGSGISVLGLLRIFDLPPFKHPLQIKEEPKQIDITEQENYIIGKLPTKYR